MLYLEVLMQITTDEQLIKTRARIGNYFFVLGFVLIGVSLFLTWFRQEQILLAFAALLLGFLLTNFGTYNMGKWGRVPNTAQRADQLLEKELKGLDNRYRLYNYCSRRLAWWCWKRGGKKGLFAARGIGGSTNATW
jgi:hypothetical protein